MGPGPLHPRRPPRRGAQLRSHLARAEPQGNRLLPGGGDERGVPVGGAWFRAAHALRAHHQPGPGGGLQHRARAAAPRQLRGRVQDAGARPALPRRGPLPGGHRGGIPPDVSVRAGGDRTASGVRERRRLPPRRLRDRSARARHRPGGPDRELHLVGLRPAGLQGVGGPAGRELGHGELRGQPAPGRAGAPGDGGAPGTPGGPARRLRRRRMAEPGVR